jgi:hypothetical protein
MDFLGINYYTILYVKDHPHDAPSDKRDFVADMSAKSICECHMRCILVTQSLFSDRVYSVGQKPRKNVKFNTTVWLLNS